jgi:excisionase family DNA binding protein
MEESFNSIPFEKKDLVSLTPEFLSVREAAQIMGVSERSVYGYIATGRIQGFRAGNMMVVRTEVARQYRRQAPGRVRVNTPPWHVPPINNLEYLTDITVQIRQGQSELFEQKLGEMRAAGKHLLPGTAARYIVRGQNNPDEVQIMLVWRHASMPPEEVREAALAALCADFADILDWETAVYKEGKVVMHA